MPQPTYSLPWPLVPQKCWLAPGVDVMKFLSLLMLSVSSKKIPTAPENAILLNLLACQDGPEEHGQKRQPVLDG